MSTKRIVEETVCEHGNVGACFLHTTPKRSGVYCKGGSRRVLGDHLLIEKVDGSWPKWVNQYHLRLGTTSDLLDALAEEPK